MDPLALWATTFGLLAGSWLVLAWRRGPQQAIGIVVLLTFLVPTWCKIEVSQSVWIDVRVAVTIFCLVAYCFHPRATFPWRLGPLDFCMICLLGIHAVSDIENSGWSLAIPARIYGEWCVPYLAGRLALHRQEDFRVLAPLGIAIGALFSVGAIFEGFSGERPWELIYGERDLDGISRDHIRWGLYRAWGCCAHPIFFGFLQVLCLPWLLRLWNIPGYRPHTVGLYLLCLAGIFSTGSRGPLLAALAIPCIALFALVPRIRIPLAAVVGILAVVGLSQRETLLLTLTKWGESIKPYESYQIVVDGKTVQSSGTMTRIHLLQVYRAAMIKASWLGFGTENVTHFPVRVPVGPQEEKTLEKVPYIDNQFVLMTLRFGWLGATVFTLALGLSVVNWFWRMPLMERRRDKALCAYAAGTILAVGCGLATVWMSHDIGFPLLWWVGCGSSIGFVGVHREVKTGDHKPRQARGRE